MERETGACVFGVCSFIYLVVDEGGEGEEEKDGDIWQVQESRVGLRDGRTQEVWRLTKGQVDDRQSLHKRHIGVDPILEGNVQGRIHRGWVDQRTSVY